MKKKYILLGISLIVIISLVSFQVQKVSANPSYFTPTVQTSTATTTPTFMTPGTATSTLVHDSYNSGNPTKSNQIALLTQFTASSTAAVLAINLEYSQGAAGFDCTVTPTACDWYQDVLLDNNSRSTTTQAANITPTNSYTWTFASSTVGGGAVNATTGGRATRAMVITSPTRYTRFVYTLTGANAAIWGQIVPIKERQ